MSTRGQRPSTGRFGPQGLRQWFGVSGHLRTIAPAAALAVWLAGCASIGRQRSRQPADHRQRPGRVRLEPQRSDRRRRCAGRAWHFPAAARARRRSPTACCRRSIRPRCAPAPARIRCSTAWALSPACPAARSRRPTYGLKKREALADFREKFLIRNAEEGSTPASIRSAWSRRSAAASTTCRTFSQTG